ncbi:MAG: MerR family transcriptional regulator [Ruthenibacterium lactatiformans]
MEYTVNGLARLAGVSVRTLHWYDEIGLLRPARVTEAGYRMYGPDEVDALQSILFYRALGVPLKQIGALMAGASAGRLAALQSHRAALLCRRAQRALLATLDKTILTEEGKCAMTDAEKFEGFKQKLVAENEAEYGAEARGKYGDTAVDASNAKLMGLSPEQYGECRSERGSTPLWPPRCARAKRRTGRGAAHRRLHKQWLCFTGPHAQGTPRPGRNVCGGRTLHCLLRR